MPPSRKCRPAGDRTALGKRGNNNSGDGLVDLGGHAQALDAPALDFCAIPSRAMADERFSASHFRLLSAIAWHDRFSVRRNSAGCYASQDTLAKETGIHRTNIGRLAADLDEWRYIRVDRHPEDRRRRTYRVIYGDAATIVGQPTNFPPAPSSPSEPQKLGNPTNLLPQIVGEPSSQDVDPKWKSVAEYIPLNGIIKKGSLRRDCANHERDLAEAPASNGCEPSRELQWGAQLARLERLTGLQGGAASELLMAAHEAGCAEIGGSTTSDEQIVEILRGLRECGSVLAWEAANGER